MKSLQKLRLLCAVSSIVLFGCAQTSTYVYVSNSVSKNIQVSELDSASGALTPRQTQELEGTVMPMAVSPDKRFLFAALRSKPYAVASFAIDHKNGLLRPVGNFPLPESMANIATDRSGKLLLAASYGGNLLSVSRITESGEVLPAHQIIPTKPMAHSVQTTLDNRFAFATSLGGDVLMLFRLDPVQGVLLPNTPVELALPEKSGPRHLAFHPGGRYVYVMDELDAVLHTFSLDAERGTLTLLGSQSTLPKGFSGKAAGADIHLTPDGRLLYTSDRGSNTLAGFRMDSASGLPVLIGNWPSESQPRGFNIDPSGRYLLEVGQTSGMLSTHAIQSDGSLVKLKTYPAGKGPNWVEMLTLPRQN